MFSPDEATPAEEGSLAIIRMLAATLMLLNEVAEVVGEAAIAVGDMLKDIAEGDAVRLDNGLLVKTASWPPEDEFAEVQAIEAKE